MRMSSGLANLAMERVLELSADAQIERRMTPKDSPEFHSLSGEVGAYGKVLALLAALRAREEFYAMIGQVDLAEYASGPIH